MANHAVHPGPRSALKRPESNAMVEELVQRTQDRFGTSLDQLQTVFVRESDAVIIRGW